MENPPARRAATHLGSAARLVRRIRVLAEGRGGWVGVRGIVHPIGTLSRLAEVARSVHPVFRIPPIPVPSRRWTCGVKLGHCG